MNGILGARSNAVLFTPAVFGSGKDGHKVLRFQASRPASRRAESAASAGIFNNYGEPLVRHFFFHRFLHLRTANLAARDTIMATAKHERK